MKHMRNLAVIFSQAPEVLGATTQLSQEDSDRNQRPFRTAGLNLVLLSDLIYYHICETFVKHQWFTQ